MSSVACNQGNKGWHLCNQPSISPIWSDCSNVLTSVLWQQEINVQQNPSPYYHQFFHKDSGTIQFSLDLYQLTYFISSNESWCFPPPIDCTSNQSGALNIFQKSEEKMYKYTDSQANTHLFLDYHKWMCLCCGREKKKKTFNGIFVLWAFTLKGGKDCYDSETFTVMGHNPWKHLGRLGYCPWTSSPFNLHSYSFGNFIHLKYHLCNEDSYICICNLEHSPEFETHKITWLLDIYIWTAVRNPNVNISKETELLILFLFQTGSTLIHSRFHF